MTSQSTQSTQVTPTCISVLFMCLYLSISLTVLTIILLTRQIIWLGFCMYCWVLLSVPARRTLLHFMSKCSDWLSTGRHISLYHSHSPTHSARSMHSAVTTLGVDEEILQIQHPSISLHQLSPLGDCAVITEAASPSTDYSLNRFPRNCG